MDKATIDKLHADIQTAVEDMCRERGLKIRRHGGSIGSTESILKFRITVDAAASPEAAQQVADAKEQQFGLYAWKFGYDASWYGKEFVGPDLKPYKIVGVKPTAEKNCLMIERMSDGKQFVCGVQFATQSGHLKKAA